MIVLDTSVWIDHLRSNDNGVLALLLSGQVLTHPFVIGEIALGSIRQRDIVLGSLLKLPRSNVATDAEVLHLIDRHNLFGRGIGYIDAHLLAAARLTPEARLWTRDRRLQEVAADFDVVFTRPRN